MKRPLGHVKREEVEPASAPVVEREGGAGQRSIVREGRPARELRGAREESGDVPQVSQIGVVLDDMAVVEVEGVPEVVGVGGEYRADRDDGEDEKRAVRDAGPGRGIHKGKNAMSPSGSVYVAARFLGWGVGAGESSVRFPLA